MEFVAPTLRFEFFIFFLKKQKFYEREPSGLNINLYLESKHLDVYLKMVHCLYRLSRMKELT